MRVKPQRVATERKNRKALSCEPCRRRKVKCDRSLPCNQCIRHDTADACQYNTGSSHRLPSDAVAPISRTEESPLSQLNQAFHPQRPMTGSEATYASFYTGDNEDPCSLHTPHSGLASPAGLDLSIQSLRQSSFSGHSERTRFFGRSHWALTIDMV